MSLPAEIAFVPEPDRDYYQAVVGELAQAEQQLASLKLLDALEGEEPEGLGQNLLEFRYPKSKFNDVPRGFALQKRLQGLSATVAFLRDEVAAFEVQEQAWRDSLPKAEALIQVVDA